MAGYESGQNYSGARTIDTDVVIVGSGASGAVVAAKLAEQGQSVLVLEEGSRVLPQEYGQMRPSQSLAEIWREGGSTAVLGVGKSPVINMTMGRCVGGSSVLTGGVCFRTPDTVLDHWAKELGLRDHAPDRVESYFDEVEATVHVEPVPESMRSGSTRKFAEGAAKRGIDIKPLRRNTEGCRGSGRCNFGCPAGAKLSVDRSYLPTAVQHGATVLSDCRVDRILFQGRRAIGVRARLLDANRRPTATLEVRAKRVVLAAGAVHTPLLLWDSGHRNRHIGRHMTVHPGFRMMAHFDEPVRGWAGSLQSAWSDAFEHRGITLVSLFVPPFALALGIPGVGAQWHRRTAELSNVAVFGGMIHDEGGGRIWRPRIGREPVMTYRMSRKDRARVPDIIRQLAEGFIAAGAKELYLPILGHEPVTPDEYRQLDLEKISPTRFECSSQHPLGTTRMGTSSRNSVCDEEGRVWNTEQLYVVDGGTVPTSLGVNPQVTIMTLATRFAERMLERRLPKN